MDREYILAVAECERLVGPAMEQARSLYASSRLLYREGRFPAAYSLFAISVEEMGKSIMCLFGNVGFLNIRMRDIHVHERTRRLTVTGAMGIHVFWWRFIPVIMHRITGESPAIGFENAPEDSDRDFTAFLEFLLDAEEMGLNGLHAGFDEKKELLVPDDEIVEDDFPPFYFRETFYDECAAMLEFCRANSAEVLEYLKLTFAKSEVPMDVDRLIQLLDIKAMK